MSNRKFELRTIVGTEVAISEEIVSETVGNRGGNTKVTKRLMEITERTVFKLECGHTTFMWNYSVDNPNKWPKRMRCGHCEDLRDAECSALNTNEEPCARK